MKGTVELLGMSFTAYHGCLPEERRNGNRFSVDFRASYDFRRALDSDALEDTLDYGDIYETVAAEMAVPSNLLEHVAGRIAEAIRKKHPELKHFSVSVTKFNPPVSGPADCSRVTVEY